MKCGILFVWLINIVFNSCKVLSLDILAVFPYSGKSHFFVFEPYLKELARRGHNLTVISYFPQEKPIQNYHDISLASYDVIYENKFPIYRSYWTLIEITLYLTQTGTDNCKILLGDENVQNLWRTERKFDLLITEQFNSDCSLGLAYKLGAPVVTLTSHTIMAWHYARHGILYNPSYVPSQSLGGGTKPSFLDRLERFILHNFMTTAYKYLCQRPNQYELQKYFEVPPLEDLGRDIKFNLIYTNHVINGANVYPPTVKEVGGYHVAEPKELPAELKKFMDESENGVIYISFGSMLQAASTPKDKVDAIVGAISELPYRVVWKWDKAALPGNPKNVYLSKWLPQNDILAHPKVVAFYSHCGMLSTTEAIHYGIPVIGMPILGDQPENAASMEESGLGVQIQISELTKESLLEKFKIVLDDKFRAQAKELSKIWHDRPMSAMDSAIYWTEFAARTKNYTFRSAAATVPLYQYLCLDILSLGIGFLLLIVLLVKFSCSLIKTKPQKQTKKVKTK